MKYIVLELFGWPDYIGPATNDDGDMKIFDTRESAETEAEECQKGLVVEIDEE